MQFFTPLVIQVISISTQKIPQILLDFNPFVVILEFYFFSSS